MHRSHIRAAGVSAALLTFVAGSPAAAQMGSYNPAPGPQALQGGEIWQRARREPSRSRTPTSSR